MSRVISWFSCGAASAVATLLTLREHPDAIPVYCVTNAEHKDNARFRHDCELAFGKAVLHLRNPEYHDTWDVWEKRKGMSFPQGAPCTRELKLKPRLEFQRPDDIQVFGYTADAGDQQRAERFKEQFFEVDARFPLIEKGLTKRACLAILEDLGIRPPITYALGLPNANCIPCPKAQSFGYWALIRKEWPEEFERAAKLSRKLGARLARVPTGDRPRIFIDEVPMAQEPVAADVPSCDFLCAIAKEDLS